MTKQRDLVLKIQEMQLEMANFQRRLDSIDLSKKTDYSDKKLNQKLGLVKSELMSEINDCSNEKYKLIKSFCTEIVRDSINDLSKELTNSQSKLMTEKLNSEIDKILADKVENIISEKVNLNFINKLYRGR